MKRHDVSRFTEKEKKIIEKMTKDTKERFFRLSTYDKKKILKSAEKVMTGEVIRDRQKKRIQKNKKKKYKMQRELKQLTVGKQSVRQVTDRVSDGSYAAARMIGILLHASDINPNREDEHSSGGQDRSSVGAVPWRKRKNRKKKRDFLSPGKISATDSFSQPGKSSSSGMISEPERRAGRKKFYQKKRESSFLTGRKAEKGKEGVEKAVRIIRNAVRQIEPLRLVVLGFLLLILLLVFLILCVPVLLMGSAASGEDDGQYQAKVSEKTESYRTLVEEYCEKYGIDDYVDLCLAVMEQESGGEPPDVMQAEQSYYNNNPPIDDAEESIDCGVHEISDCLKAASASGSGDIKNIKLALQGYNFGNGYIDWALKKDGGYTEKNAKEFSKKMCDELGYSSYGDVDYVQHVLRYYVANEKITISSKEAADLISELKSNNTAPAGAWKVIETGASLIGSVTYSMEERQDDGRDNPTVLDCSSFTAWSFHKAGYTNISYTMITTNFVSSNRFVTITADELQPGDIGLKSETAPSGGSNHVGIYCGKLKDGTKVWMHCTSSSSTSLTGNDSGAMMGSYTNFTFFRRLKKFNQ